MFGRILVSAELCAESSNEETSAHTAWGDPLSLWWHVGHGFLNNSSSIQGLVYSELVSLRGRAGLFSSTLTPCTRHCWSVG